MAHLIFRCHQTNRVITTGVEVDAHTFGKLHVRRAVPCRFCGQKHEWEVVESEPAASALMSLKAEDFLGRSVQSDTHAAQATDPGIRDLYERMAGQWFRLAADHEAKAETLG